MSVIQSEKNDRELNGTITAALTEFSRRRVRLLVLRALSAGLMALIATMSIVAIFDYLWMLSDSLRWILSLLAYGITILATWRYGWRSEDRDDPRRIALQFESADPRLHESLLSAVELADPSVANGSQQFRDALQDQTSRQLSSVQIGNLLPVALIRPWLWSAVIMFFVMSMLFVVPNMQFARRIARAMLPAAAIQRASVTKIYVSEPSPPSRPVAAGDAIGVVATIAQLGEDQPLLQWRTAHTAHEQRPMTRRTGTNVFTAIIAVDEQPVEYRILAGDAITLWHRLTPVPRPQIESFSITYRFPDYASTPERTVTQDHGDLKAVRGTVAKVVINLSEPCSQAQLEFIGGRDPIEMSAVNDRQTAYAVDIPIVQPNRYQITARGAKSGLTNPQAQPAHVVPMVDQPPVVDWDISLKKQQIVSRIDVVSLLATVQDEFPIEKLAQEYQLNGGPIVRRPLSLESIHTNQLVWDWDLLERESEFSSGDVIHTYLVALDRRGQRGESSKLELLLSDDGFATDRYDQTNRLHSATKSLIDWTQSASQQMMTAAKSLTSEQLADDSLPSTQSIVRSLNLAIRSADSPNEASRLELSANLLLDLERRIDDWYAERQWLGTNVESENSTWRENRTDQLKTEAQRCASDARRIESYLRDQLSQLASIGLMDDATALMKSLRKIVDEEMPLDRRTRHLRITDGRLAQIEATFAKYADAASDSFQSQLKNWSRFQSQQRTILTREIEQPESSASQRRAIEGLLYELEIAQSDRAIYSAPVSLRLTKARDELPRNFVQIGDATENLAFDIDQITDLKRKIKTSVDSNRVAEWNNELRFIQERLKDRQLGVLQTLQNVRDLHTAHPSSDLAFIADLGLTRRAIDQIRKATDEDPNNLPDGDADALRNVASAFQLLRSGHELVMWKRDLRDLGGSEFEQAGDAEYRYWRPQRFEAYVSGIRWPSERLAESKIPTVALRRNIHVATADQIQRARTLLSNRHFDRERTVSVRPPLREIESELSQYLADLEPSMEAARDVIRRYAITLHRQAKEAAEKVRSAIESTESDNGTREALLERHQAADLATKQTMESLADLANTLSAADPESRELARDADSALALIGQQRDRVNDAIKSDAAPADLAESLKQLRERLDQTGDHFEKANAGEDLTESRQAIRRAEQDQEIKNQLAERAERTTAFAESAEQEKEQLRKQLEDSALESESMRDALSEVAQQTVRRALASLRQSADDERATAQRIERSDPELAEQNQRLTDRLRRLGDQLYSIDRILGTTLTRLAGEADLEEASDPLRQARESIRSTARFAEEQLADEGIRDSILAGAKEMSNRVDQAKRSIDAFGSAVEQRLSKSDDPPATIEQRDAQRQMRNVRDQQIRAANELKRIWTKVKQESDQRVDRAIKQAQSNQFAREQLEDQSEPITAQIRTQLESLQQRIDQSSQAENAARQSVASAKRQMNLSSQRADELRQEIIAPFEFDSPTAEATGRLAAKATDELTRIVDQLKQIIAQSESNQSLAVPRFAIDSLQSRQQQIVDEIDQTGNGLRRAALNEQRLGRDESAEQIADSATRVKRIAASSATRAISELQRARDDSESARSSLQEIATAEQQLNAEANLLAKLLGEMPGGRSDAQENERHSSAENQEQQDRARQTARALDELDQANQQNPDSEQSAGEASATLQQAMEEAARQAAQERQKQIGPGSSDPQKPNDNDDATAAGDNPFGGTPGGQQADLGSVSIDRTNRTGADWGFLRVRQGGDDSEILRTQVPARYRRQIEAYFRAVAERSSGEDR